MLPGHADALRVFRGGQKMTSPTTTKPTEVDVAVTPTVAEGSVAVPPAAEGSVAVQGVAEKGRSLRPLSAVGARARAQPAKS